MSTPQLSPIKPNTWGFTFKGKLKPVEYQKQAADMIPRFQKKLGEKVLSNGHPVWTNIKIFCYTPTFEHPFRIHLQLSNKSGSGLAEITLDEFNALLLEIQAWKNQYDETFIKANEQSNKLEHRSSLFNDVKILLSNLDIPIDNILSDKVQLIQYPEALIDNIKLLIDKLTDPNITPEQKTLFRQTIEHEYSKFSDIKYRETIIKYLNERLLNV